MDQLSGTDYVSLCAEQGNTFNHVAMLMVYDASTAPGGAVRFRDILRHFENRLYLYPVLRAHLTNALYDLDRPYLVHDSEIDLDYHIRHLALPKPGDWRQLMIQVARIHSRPLDRTRPLWEAYVIEGLDNIPNLPPGAFAIMLKIHHAVVDGMAAVHLITQLHSTSPEPDADPDKPALVVGEYSPSALELLSRSLDNWTERLKKLASVSSTLSGKAIHAGAQTLGKLAEFQLSAIGDLFKGLSPNNAPHTRFSEKVSANRVVEGIGLPLSDIKRIRQLVPGTTLNDIFIAMAGGATRKYLLAKRELPEVSMTALMPISIRTDATSGGNAVSGVPVVVRTDIADPLERLVAVHEEALKSKAKAEKMGLDTLSNLLDVLPSAAVNLLLNKVMVPLINMTVSNVRGPDKPIYLAGAKAVCVYPVSIPADGGGLNFTGVSYNGVMWISMVCCRKMMPDPGFMLECMHEAWSELLVAAEKQPAVTPAVKKATAKKTPAAGKSKIKPKSNPDS